MRSLGFTLLETVMVIAIVTLLLAFSLTAFRNLGDNEALGKDAALVTAILAQARSLALSSKNNDQFGVHLTSSSVTLFEGTSYVAGASTNRTDSLNSRVTITAISLSGGGSDIIFRQLTGDTTNSGTVTLSQVGDATKTRSVTIYKTGLIETP